MPIRYNSVAKNGWLTSSINQDLLDQFEPYKRLLNFSAEAEQLLVGRPEDYKNRAWAERNADALDRHGTDIASTGLAGAEFERI
jgi:hypothetical protein